MYVRKGNDAKTPAIFRIFYFTELKEPAKRPQLYAAHAYEAKQNQLLFTFINFATEGGFKGLFIFSNVAMATVHTSA